LSLNVERRDFGLLGHNSAGKSTTLGILLRQVFPDSGRPSSTGFRCRNRGRASLAQARS
jgi:ABC-2 type transport system ATP-binding protein